MRPPDSRPPLEDGPLRPADPTGEIHVWRIEVGGAGAAPGSLTASARLALRSVLSRYLDEDPDAIELVLGERGKPALADSGSRLEFNLSHSRGLALVAVASGHPVGVDVEWVGRQRDFLALAARELGEDVVTTLRAARPEERGAIFYAAWARHEARAKCHGGGLGGPPPPGQVAVTQLVVGDAYAAALAAPGETVPAPRLYRLEPR